MSGAPEFAEVEVPVRITLTLAEAERLSANLADILCWAAGFRAARQEDTSTHPMGIEGVRDIRDVLSRAIIQAGTK